MGNHSFKNVSDESEIFEIEVEKPENLHVDPVCRMLLTDPQKRISHPFQPDLFFCSINCLQTFMEKE